MIRIGIRTSVAGAIVILLTTLGILSIWLTELVDAKISATIGIVMATLIVIGLIALKTEKTVKAHRRMVRALENLTIDPKVLEWKGPPL